MREELFKKKYKVYEPNDQQKAELYEIFRNEQKGQFLLYINYINEVLCILKDYRIVSDFTKYNARIKAPDSAIPNDDIENVLDDVFGIEVDFGTKGEKFFVSEIIKATLNTVRQKIHKKDNGYDAYHVMGYPVSKNVLVPALENLLEKKINPNEEYQKFYESLAEKDREKFEPEKDKKMNFFDEQKEALDSFSTSVKKIDEYYLNQLKMDLQEVEDKYLKKQNAITTNEYIPVIEFQSKTIDVAARADSWEEDIGHDKYKGISSKEMQKIYDSSKGKIPTSEVPQMYTGLKRDENGKICPMRLRSINSTLRKMNPQLITIGRRDIEKKGEEK